jgi:hypothetical protein
MAEVQQLSDEVKTFIVQELACFETPSEVEKSVKAMFDITISRQRVQGYDPTKRQGKDLGKEMRAIFEETRKTFLEETALIGIANRAVRLRKLDKIAADNAKNPMVVMQACEAAAKEMGGAYSNKLEHKHSGQVGMPVQAVVVNTTDPLEAAKIYQNMLNGPT